MACNWLFKYIKQYVELGVDFMSKELTPLEALEELGVFNAYEFKVRLSEKIQNLYIKLQGTRLTKIKNIYFDDYNGEIYKVVGNTIYSQRTYEPSLEEDIPDELREWNVYSQNKKLFPRKNITQCKNHLKH